MIIPSKTIQQFLIFIVISFMMVFSVQANPYSPKEENIQNQNPWPLLQQSIKKLNEISYFGQSLRAKYIIDKDLLPLFDFHHIVKNITRIIPHQFNDAQYQYFEQLIQRDLSTILLLQLTSQKIYGFRINNIQPIAQNYLKITLGLNINSFAPVELDLFINNDSDMWKIVDVALNNNSLVRYYQRVIIGKIRRYGIQAIFNI